METLKKIGIGLISLLFIFAMGCQKERYTGSMTVNLTDAPAAYEAVNVDIRSVQIHYEDNDEEGEGKAGWIALSTKSGIYDLLELQNDVTVLLAEGEEIPEGNVTQLRLMLGDNNTLELENGDVEELTVPSGVQTGIKINIDSEIKAEKDLEVLLDFDANKSVVDTGSGKYLLKPVIKVEEIHYDNEDEDDES